MASTRQDQAVELFKSGYNCAQAVAGAFAPDVEIDRDTALRTAAAFGGGIGGTGKTCGALSGLLIVLGCKYGRREPADMQSKAEMVNISQQAIKIFIEQTGARDCRDLLGFDLAAKEGKAAASKDNAFDVCPDLVRTAAEIAEKLLQDDQHE
ncbi:C_GCAxxG_C_C family protein [Anaerohalosphaera lusitana]|uniref:C_GCAxxG_C_C family protein n=1 Tax=Anaerohalosphaera lusitana TaxID=1936003 RepID=A0A1U9NPM5_9BACT|nr:C-GCAxxG-C-C family protein [Anaerohalosphaera lusitana]AQT69737.1 C_GCAxxG_C_C family protein [Anaerohalosphaera lusitana]